MNLQEFLNKNNISNLKKEVTISKRLANPETGELFKFKIRALTQKEFEEARNAATTMPRNRKERVQVNNAVYYSKIIIAGCVEPNFKSAESISAVGVVTPEDYLNSVLLPGEINDLATAILDLSGFENDMDELIEEAKNL